MKMIEDGVAYCPACGKSQELQKPIYKRWWVWAIVIFVVFVISGNIDSGREYYIVMAENIVTEHLKSPSTAEFCKGSEYTIAVADNLALVQGYVDSQNGFGATIRSPFLIEIDVIDAKNFRCEIVYMQIGENEYYNFVDADWKLLK